MYHSGMVNNERSSQISKQTEQILKQAQDAFGADVVKNVEIIGGDIVVSFKGAMVVSYTKAEWKELHKNVKYVEVDIDAPVKA